MYPLPIPRELQVDRNTATGQHNTSSIGQPTNPRPTKTMVSKKGGTLLPRPYPTADRNLVLELSQALTDRNRSRESINQLERVRQRSARFVGNSPGQLRPMIRAPPTPFQLHFIMPQYRYIATADLLGSSKDNRTTSY
jgi:hypothetical protein